MPSVLRMIRAMIVTGLTFGIGVGAVGAIVGLILVWVGQGSFDDLRMVGQIAVVAFLVGAFSHWSLASALGNLAILTFLGSGFATGTLMLARRGRAELKTGEGSRLLSEE